MITFASKRDNFKFVFRYTHYIQKPYVLHMQLYIVVIQNLAEAVFLLALTTSPSLDSCTSKTKQAQQKNLHTPNGKKKVFAHVNFMHCLMNGNRIIIFYIESFVTLCTYDDIF